MAEKGVPGRGQPPSRALPEQHMNGERAVKGQHTAMHKRSPCPGEMTLGIPWAEAACRASHQAQASGQEAGGCAGPLGSGLCSLSSASPMGGSSGQAVGRGSCDGQAFSQGCTQTR